MCDPTHEPVGTRQGWIDIPEPEDLMACTPELQPGDILLLDTGWWDKCGGTPEYEKFPCLSQAAAEWLVEMRCKLVGIDNGTPEMAKDMWPKGWKWPVHHTLFSRGVLVGEFVRNMKALAGQRVEVMFLALNLAGADGAPARVIARPHYLGSVEFQRGFDFACPTRFNGRQIETPPQEGTR